MNLLRDRLSCHFNLGLNLLLGGGLTLLVTGLTLALELEQTKSRYQRFSDHLTQHFQESLENSSRVSQTLTSFYRVSDQVTTRDFTQFTLFLLQEYPDLSGIAWIQRVPHAQKSNFKQSFLTQNQSAFSIFQWDHRQMPIAADDRHEYFPLTYSEPLDRFQSLLGFDLGSQQTYRLFLNQAIVAENAVVGSPIADKQRNIFGFALYHPIYRRGQFTKNAEERRRALVGFVYTEHPWQEMIRAGLHSANLEQLDFYLVNVSGTERRLLMFHDRQQNRIIDHPDQLKRLQADSNRLRLPIFCHFLLKCQHSLQIANQSWSLVLIPNWPLSSIPWKTMGVAILGGGITTLATGLEQRSQREKEKLKAIYNQKKLELCQLEGELAQKIEQQSAELRAAQRANNELLGNISHELRTPLNIISGFIQLLNRDPQLSERQRSTLAVISRSGDYLLALFNDILEMAQIEEGNTTIRQTVFSIVSLVGSVIDMLQLKARAKGLRLNLYVSEEIPAYVKTDEGKLRQILMNLLDNAIKFTDRGSITLRVESSDGGWGCEKDLEERDDTQVFMFEVEDTGRGIPASEWEQIFEPFIQGNAIRRQPSQGTGLGLYITRRLIRLMGGDIRVIESAVDRGTLFRFSLPLKLPSPRELAVQQSYQRIVGLAPYQPEFRILIVDGRPENRQLFSQLLVPLGFQLREANNGEEAIAIWPDWRPHAIFMDTRMPVMDELRAIEHIRDRTQLKQTVLIAITSSGMTSKQVDRLAIACDDILHKPFNVDTILDKLAKHLGVIYRYDDCEEISHGKEWAHTTITCSLQPQDLAAMSIEWRENVFKAASAGDSRCLLELIAQIPADRIHLISELTELVKFFQFSVLRELTAHEPIELLC